MTDPIYLEDLAVGDTFTSGEHCLDVEQIIRFAREYDPQPFHLTKALPRTRSSKGWPPAAGRPVR